MHHVPAQIPWLVVLLFPLSCALSTTISLTLDYHTLLDKIINFLLMRPQLESSSNAHLHSCISLITTFCWGMEPCVYREWLTICYHNSEEVLNLNCLFDFLIQNICMYFLRECWSFDIREASGSAFHNLDGFLGTLSLIGYIFDTIIQHF